MRFNDDGKPLGGMECVCTDLAGCDIRMAQNVKDLGTAVGVSSPQKGKGKEKGKSKQKGKGLTDIGSSVGKGSGKEKGKHQEKGKRQVKGKNKRGQ